MRRKNKQTSPGTARNTGPPPRAILFSDFRFGTRPETQPEKGSDVKAALFFRNEGCERVNLGVTPLILNCAFLLLPHGAPADRHTSRFRHINRHLCSYFRLHIDPDPAQPLLTQAPEPTFVSCV